MNKCKHSQIHFHQYRKIVSEAEINYILSTSMLVKVTLAQRKYDTIIYSTLFR